MGVEARFASLARPLDATVLEVPEGRVHWHCLQPRADASIAHAGSVLRGLGYVERLTVTLPPWSLPIDELAWGRFLGDRHTMVWIDWRGPHARKLVWLDGEEMGEGAGVRRRSITSACGDVSLTIEDGRVLRRGALGKTALAVVPAIDRVLPVRILAVDETKWCARGVLAVLGTRDEGWVIHEEVRWPAR